MKKNIVIFLRNKINDFCISIKESLITNKKNISGIILVLIIIINFVLINNLSTSLNQTREDISALYNEIDSHKDAIEDVSNKADEATENSENALLETEEVRDNLSDVASSVEDVQYNTENTQNEAEEANNKVDELEDSKQDKYN